MKKKTTATAPASAPAATPTKGARAKATPKAFSSIPPQANVVAAPIPVQDRIKRAYKRAAVAVPAQALAAAMPAAAVLVASDITEVAPAAVQHANGEANTNGAAGMSSIAAFGEQIQRAASIGRRLQQAGSALMAGLPMGSSDEDTGLHLLRTNLDQYEGAVRVLALANPHGPAE